MSGEIRQAIITEIAIGILLLTVMCTLCGCGTYGGSIDHPVFEKVDVSYFKAYVQNDCIQLEWQTTYEKGCGGYYILRNIIGNNMESKKIDPQFIRAKGGAGRGALYVQEDKDIKSGETYKYTLVGVMGYQGSTQLKEVTAEKW